MTDDAARWREAKLLVIGDSHATFFKGHDGVNDGPDAIPGVITLQTPGAIAWSLVRPKSTMQGREASLACLNHAFAAGFRGWLMFSFGEIDLRVHVLKHAPRVGLEAAVLDVVDRYARFVDEVRAVHGKVALWGPIGSHPEDLLFNPDSPTVGSEVERNMASLLFTRLLRGRMAARGVPVLSLLPQMLRDDGRTWGGLLHDGIHLSQTLMPSAVALVRRELGIELSPPTSPVDFGVYEMREFSRAEPVELEGRRWLALEMRNAFLVESVTFVGAAREAFGEVEVRTSLDGVVMQYQRGAVDETPPEAGAEMAIGRLARFVLVHAPGRAFAREEVRVSVRATRLLAGAPGNGGGRRVAELMSEALAESIERRLAADLAHAAPALAAPDIAYA